MPSNIRMPETSLPSLYLQVSAVQGQGLLHHRPTSSPFGSTQGFFYLTRKCVMAQSPNTTPFPFLGTQTHMASLKQRLQCLKGDAWHGI